MNNLPIDVINASFLPLGTILTTYHRNEYIVDKDKKEERSLEILKQLVPNVCKWFVENKGDKNLAREFIKSCTSDEEKVVFSC